MCGLFGVAGFVEPQSPAPDVEAALRAIRHRGPDGFGVYRSPGVVLGHVRLSIIDLTPAGKQPMLSPDSRVALVFNGEIYNHHSLRHELENLGFDFRSRSDTEVILHGYRAWGAGVLERIDGMFALAIWDAVEKQLLLARDRSGKKPLFYSERDGAIWFASEPKALFAAGLDAEVELRALPLVLALGYTPAPLTMYKGVKQLPPASSLTFSKDAPPRLREFWRVPETDPSAPQLPSDAHSHIRTLLEAAVERRLEADVPLGAFLSGGLDSTIVVGLMARNLGTRKVKTFSIGFSGDDRFDETRYARIAANAFSTEHTEFIVEPSSFDLIERLVELHDGPFGDSSAVPTSVLSMLTRRHVTVALTGDGGDELFCGYPRFLAAEAAERLTPIRWAAPILKHAVRRGSNEQSFGGRASRFLRDASSTLSDRMYGWTTYFNNDLSTIVRRDVAQQIDLSLPRHWNDEMMWRHRETTTLSRILAHNFETYLPYDLLVKSDRASMLHSLEVRSPFLDTALVDYVARLPDSAKRRGWTTKWALRCAFEDLVPPEIQRRKKMGFSVPLATWFRGDLKGHLYDRLAAGSALYNYVERSYVERLLREHDASSADHSRRLWLLLTLQIWLQQLAQTSAQRAEHLARAESVIS